MGWFSSTNQIGAFCTLYTQLPPWTQGQKMNQVTCGLESREQNGEKYGGKTLLHVAWEQGLKASEREDGIAQAK